MSEELNGQSSPVPQTPFWTNSNTVNWPSGWTDDEKVAWLISEFHLQPEGRGYDRHPANFVCLPYAGEENFDYRTYDTEKFVLVHGEVFKIFLDSLDNERALTKGMRTVNKRRRKETIEHRRVQRKLARARSSRDTAQRKLENQRQATEAYKVLAEQGADFSQRQAEQYKASVRYNVGVIKNLRAEIAELKQKQGGYLSEVAAAHAVTPEPDPVQVAVDHGSSID